MKVGDKVIIEGVIVKIVEYDEEKYLIRTNKKRFIWCIENELKLKTKDFK